MDQLNEEQKAAIATARTAALTTCGEALANLNDSGDGEVTLTEVLQAGSPNVEISDEILD